MNLSQIVECLENRDVEYKLVRPNYSIDVFAANFKKKISNGLYHVTEGFNGSVEEIKNSIIVTNCDLETENTLILVENPQLVYYIILQFFKKTPINTIDRTAIIHPEAIIGKNVNIGAYSVIGKCNIEDDVCIQAHVVIYEKVTIKKATFIDCHCCIGPEGLVWIWDEKGNRIHQPQLGGVLIEENCHIGTDVTIVKGSLSEDTIIGAETVISHGTKIGHGAKIGKLVHMANNVSLAGNTTVGNRSYLGSGSIVSSNVEIANNCIVGAGAMVNKSFREDYCTLVGVPARILNKENYKEKGKGTPLPYKKDKI